MFSGLVNEEIERIVRGVYAKANHGDIIMKYLYHEGTKDFHDPHDWLMLSEAVKLNNNFGSNLPECDNGLIDYRGEYNLTAIKIGESYFIVVLRNQNNEWGMKFGSVPTYTDGMTLAEMYANGAFTPKKSKLPYASQAALFSTVFSILIKHIKEKEPAKVIFSGASDGLAGIYYRAFNSPDVKKYLEDVGRTVDIEVNTTDPTKTQFKIVPKE